MKRLFIVIIVFLSTSIFQFGTGYCEPVGILQHCTTIAEYRSMSNEQQLRWIMSIPLENVNLKCNMIAETVGELRRILEGDPSLFNKYSNNIEVFLNTLYKRGVEMGCGR